MNQNKHVNLKSFKQTQDVESLHPYIREHYITEDGFLKIRLDTKMFPMTDFLVKTRFYDMVAFINYLGEGKVFRQQLIQFIMQTRKVSKSRAIHIMNELVYYKLVDLKPAWNNKMVVLKTQAHHFFGNHKATSKYSVGHILKRTFFVQHYLQYGMETIADTETRLLELSILKPDHLTELERYKFMRVESAEETVSGSIHITFAFLNYQKTVSSIALENRVKYLNAILPMDRDISFSIRVCNYSNDINTLAKRRWQPHAFDVESSYYRFKGFTFTNMQIRRYFDVSVDKYEVMLDD